MNTSWWLALVAVVLLALVAALVDGWGRGHRSRVRSAPARAGTGTQEGDGRPRPAEIWWADVPYEDVPRAGNGAPAGGAASKDRPCLVLAVRGERATVAKITTRFREGRAGVVPLPPGSVGDARGRASYLETDELREVPLREFRRRVGAVDPAVWKRVRRLAR
ncbi:type II toxin-antitoxin system PemK/MazF family toxin [Streptomyces prasinopilosus]|uniref:mRNA-degrading endonuclease, toxin component of the MazEF toxin-antitoxin module n=1 Tax=Streptomyces prasinopilosus TaxID=67344 RepID=A0A1G6I7E4_9ACTN|nr:type II toxin-antitoxin system PemK/MazF family toxin [Streptomyces prasinopilosus]SDC01935.1 mRNA-degrading endonuclease, toxin component of the MazEF toxin-antitoxin module [Streptomyces prasinopilosus]